MNNIEIHQKLMDEVYSKWQEKEFEHMDRLEIIDKFFDKKHKVAVQLGNLNYQVENGGFSQWFFNSYGDEDIDNLIEYLSEAITKKIPYSEELYNILYLIKNEHMDITCPNCQGYGYVDCSECDCDGTIDCYECSGEGYIEDEDDEDNKITCSFCNGEAVIECGECCGEGHIECESCKGEGRVHVDDNGIEQFDERYFNIEEENRFKLFVDIIRMYEK